MFFLRSPFTIFVQLNENHGVMTHTLLFLGLGMQEILLIAYRRPEELQLGNTVLHQVDFLFGKFFSMVWFFIRTFVF